MEMRKAYEQFKKLHPRTRQAYLPTPANYAKWMRAIEAAETNAALAEFKRDTSAIDAIAERRRVTAFEDFPAVAKPAYRVVARAYAGRQVWACGSRVKGCWVEPGCEGEAQVRAARAAAGMADKVRSDWDYFAEPDTVQHFALPAQYDRCRVRIPPGELVAIPIYDPKNDWDFSRLPESEHGSALSALESGDVETLRRLHDTYKLSPYTYCCSGQEDVQGLRSWFAWAADSGIIKNSV